MEEIVETNFQLHKELYVLSIGNHGESIPITGFKSLAYFCNLISYIVKSEEVAHGLER